MSKGFILVICQFILIAVILQNRGFMANELLGMLIQMLGFSLGLISIFQMKLHNLSIKPEPKENAELIQSGIYKYIRHPMYMSILVFLCPLIDFESNSISLNLFILLIIVLAFKMNYEETLLRSKFPEYENYIGTTKRLIPFIY